MADTKEEPPNSTADDSYGHVVDGVIFPPGVVSAFAPRRGGEPLSSARKEIIRLLLTPFVFSIPKSQTDRYLQKKAR